MSGTQGWFFQYWNGSAWVQLANAELDHVMEELSSVGGQEELVFWLPNTPANVSLVESKPFVQLLFNGNLVYPYANGGTPGVGAAMLTGYQFTPTRIMCIAYNYEYVLLNQASYTVTQAYTNANPQTILQYICALAGATYYQAPSSPLSITFNNVNCYKAVQQLAAACGMEYWADQNGVNIGVRTSTSYTPQYIGENTKRSLNYAKTIDKVIITGVDANGNTITGVAGVNGSVATFTEKKISSQATLNALAAFKLAKLNNPSNGNTLDILITDNSCYSWRPGMYLSLNLSSLALVGSYEIQRMTKRATRADVEIDAAMPQQDIMIETDTNNIAQNIDSTTVQDSLANPAQAGLMAYFPLDEGSGTTVYDQSNYSSQGTISGGYTWSSGPIAPILTLNGSTGQVDITDFITFAGLNACAVACWFSPSTLATGNLIFKSGQFQLALTSTNTIFFAVYINGSWYTATAPANTVNTTEVNGGRYFVVGVYAGSYVQIYVNGVLEAQTVATGNLAASTSDVLIGTNGSAYFAGVIADVMLWSIAPSSSVLSGLYSQPTQVLPTSPSVIGATQNSVLNSFDYLIYYDAPNNVYCAVNGTTGNIDFGGVNGQITTEVSIIQAAINNLYNGGLIILKDLAVPTGLTIPSNVAIMTTYNGVLTLVNSSGSFLIGETGTYLTIGTSIKSSYSASLSYLLNTLISGNIVQASAGGTMNSYESGYVCLALLQQGSSYYSQVQSILDLWASLQNSDGSWYQQYEPYSPYTNLANVKVDSGAALLAWAMSYYDQLTSGTRYKTNVQNALSFLRQLQYDHTVEYSTNLIANLIDNGTVDNTALLADCAECLLSLKAAMDAYGSSLETSAGYSVQTFANNLYYSICVTGWRGSSALYFDTSYPYGQNTQIPFNYQEKISYTQALCSRAVYVFAKSAYQNVGDYSGSICQPCLNYIITVVRGIWGGIYYCPYTGASGQTQNNYSGYSAHMCIAAQTVSSSTYTSLISGLQAFIKWCTLPGGQVYDIADETGMLWPSQLPSGSAGPFLALDIALALLAGAGS